MLIINTYSEIFEYFSITIIALKILSLLDILSTGLLFREFIKEFQAEEVTMAWLPGLLTGLTQFSGKKSAEDIS